MLVPSLRQSGVVIADFISEATRERGPALVNTHLVGKSWGRALKGLPANSLGIFTNLRMRRMEAGPTRFKHMVIINELVH